jgi:F-type H+-transporting ATPase subunit b
MLDFNYTLLIQFLNFILLLIILNFLLFKPVLKVLERRQEAIAASSEQVKSMGDETKHLQASYEESSRERRRPILEARDSVLAEAHGTSVKTIEQARNELSGELTRIRSEIAKDSQKAFQDLKQDVGRLSMEAAEKIVGRSLS